MSYSRLKRIIDRAHSRALKYADHKASSMATLSEYHKSISRKLKRAKFRSIGAFLKQYAQSPLLSNPDTFKKNLNHILGSRLRGITDAESSILWDLSTKKTGNPNLSHLDELLKKEKILFSKSIVFLRSLTFTEELADYIESVLPILHQSLSIIYKEQEALNDGNLDRLIYLFNLEKTIHIPSITQFSRRSFLGTAAAAATLSLSFSSIASALEAYASASIKNIKGTNYDVGTDYNPGEFTRMEINTWIMQEELSMIKNKLGCNAVRIYGGREEQLLEATRIALTLGLRVWLSPRFLNYDKSTTLKKLKEFCMHAETLNKQFPDQIVLIVANEITLDTSEFISGRTYGDRSSGLGWYIAQSYLYDGGFDSFITALIETAKEHWNGLITYAAGNWESVDWSHCDIVSVNKYWDDSNKNKYETSLAKLHTVGKPVAITEFGCGSYVGSEGNGGASTQIVNWTTNPPTLKEGHVRDEYVQRDYISRLLDLFRKHNVHATFVFNFVETHYPYVENGGVDNLDTASFNLIKVIQGRYAVQPTYYSHQDILKAAFYAVSDFYSD